MKRDKQYSCIHGEIMWTFSVSMISIIKECVLAVVFYLYVPLHCVHKAHDITGTNGDTEYVQSL